MVSQEFPKVPASSTIETDSPLYHSEGLRGAFLRHGGNQNDLIQVSDVLPNILSPEGQICQSVDMIPPRVFEDPEISYGQEHGLSLTLNSRLLSDVSLCSYKLKSSQENFDCFREDSTKSTMAGRDGHMFCEGETSYFTSKPSNYKSHDMACAVRIVQNSRYLKPTRQLLDEVVCVRDAVDPASDKQLRLISPFGLSFRSGGNPLHVEERMNQHSSEEKQDVQKRINKLIALLNKLESGYEKYFHQMYDVVSSFDLVVGKGAAASYTALTIQAMYRHFSNLRDAIVSQIDASKQSLAGGLPRNNEGLSYDRLFDQNSGQNIETLPRLSMIPHRQIWRPLRGLPENSVAVLRAWLFEHFLHPYPSDNEKLMLASRTGLTKNQISNWFINARVRLWKPMIEEMYREEFAEDSRDPVLSP